MWKGNLRGPFSVHSSCSSSAGFPDDWAEENPDDLEERKKFWDNQNFRNQDSAGDERFLTEIENVRLNYVCRKSDVGCRNCLRREVSVRLRSYGHNCTICKSTWNGGRNLLAGEHSYLEVVENSKKLGVDRLKTLIKILCSAAKACIKERKIHLAPWRKHKYMQSKWLGDGTVERLVPETVVAVALIAGYSHSFPFLNYITES
ncbi:hypothetical protein LINPERPRIM_LOCUS6612 [Linum perenne]